MNALTARARASLDGSRFIHSADAESVDVELLVHSLTHSLTHEAPTAITRHTDLLEHLALDNMEPETSKYMALVLYQLLPGLLIVACLVIGFRCRRKIRSDLHAPLLLCVLFVFSVYLCVS